MLHAEGHAASTFAAIVNDAGQGQGQHVLVLSTVGEAGEQASVAFEFAIRGERLTLSKRRVIDALLALYALCYVRRVPATITLRSTVRADPLRRPLRIWRLADRRVLPVGPPVDYTLPAAARAVLAKD
jgi:hypothetical protein